MSKAMAPHSSTLDWEMPWTEKPGGLQSMGSLRVGHDWATSLSLFTFMHWRRKWKSTPVFLPGESQGQRSLVGCRLGVAQSQTRLKWLSSSSSSSKMLKLEMTRVHWIQSPSPTSYLSIHPDPRPSFSLGSTKPPGVVLTFTSGGVMS